jgi:integrase
MPIRTPELSAKAVSLLSYGYVKGKHKPGQEAKNSIGTPCTAYHAVGGVAGLYLQCNPPKGANPKEFARSWIYRATIAGKRRDIGLGSYPSVSLSMARELAREMKGQIIRGIDPLAARKEAKAEAQRSKERAITFEHMATLFIEKKSEEFAGKNKLKQIQKLTNQLKTYAYPYIGKMSINDITTNHIADMLSPIWLTTKDLSQRVRMSCNGVFNLAKAKELLVGDNPVDLDLLKHILPTPTGKKKVLLKTTEHIPGLDFSQLTNFYHSLQSDNAMSTKLILFGLLTAARPGEARSATWEQIDLEKKIWVLQLEDMKEGLMHVVPLSEPVMALLKSMPRLGKYVFGSNGKKPASENTANERIKFLHRRSVKSGGVGFTDPDTGRITCAHGLRSVFKDWAIKHTRYPDEWSELALAHVNSDKTKAAYARNKLIKERTRLMAEFANDCIHGVPDPDSELGKQIISSRIL